MRSWASKDFCPSAERWSRSESPARSATRQWMTPSLRASAIGLTAAFGLAGVNNHTYTGWGSVTHWNAYVANTQMHGKGTFFDPRLNDPKKFPAAARQGHGNLRQKPD